MVIIRLYLSPKKKSSVLKIEENMEILKLIYM